MSKSVFIICDNTPETYFYVFSVIFFILIFFVVFFDREIIYIWKNQLYTMKYGMRFKFNKLTNITSLIMLSQRYFYEKAVDCSEQQRNRHVGNENEN